MYELYYSGNQYELQTCFKIITVFSDDTLS